MLYQLECKYKGTIQLKNLLTENNRHQSQKMMRQCKLYKLNSKDALRKIMSNLTKTTTQI